MEKESVFEYLARMKRVNSNIENIGGKPDPKDHVPYLINKLYKSEEPNDDIGDRIEQEFNERCGDLRIEETSLALDYFSEDYERAQNSAVKNFERAQRIKPTSREHGEYLRKALNLTMRATRDVEMLRRLDQDVNLIMPQTDYDIIFEALKSFRNELYFALEFPNCYKEIIPLHLQMNEAVGREDYETAAILRDEIRAIRSRAEPK